MIRGEWGDEEMVRRGEEDLMFPYQFITYNLSLITNNLSLITYKLLPITSKLINSSTYQLLNLDFLFVLICVHLWTINNNGQLYFA
ncbi:MAG: hypothetical protein QMD02_04590 [Bacteroidales bacterium]|nr:hypothetical protein [Bacteroidales bacterium]